MSALNRVDQIRNHRVHAASRSQTVSHQPDAAAATLTAWMSVLPSTYFRTALLLGDPDRVEVDGTN